MTLARTVWMAVCALTIVQDPPQPPPKPPDLAELSSSIRERIDKGADQSSFETAGQERIDFSGNIVAWAISEAVLTPEQERLEAAKVDEAIQKRIKTGDTPKAVQELFKKLTDSLPTYMKPAAFTWTLASILDDDVNAFTVGGGFVYAYKSLVDALLSEPTRGSGALAFVLAHEIGHIALGHCRRGYQRERIESDIGAVIKPAEMAQIGKVLQTSLNAAGHLVKFLYSREQEYEADLFALQLCRNAEVEVDQALDGLRWIVALQHPKVLKDSEHVPPDAAPMGLARFLVSSHPPPLRRLRRLRMELSGLLPDETSFGLLAPDATGLLVRAKDAQVGVGQRALILIHGMGGDETTFKRFRELVAGKVDEPVLTFRYPNNGSLAHAAAFLKREVSRVVTSPDRAHIVAHSAGGLVFRAYAERLEGKFDRSVFLGTPHEGSSLVAAKFLMDAAKFAPGLRQGISEAVDKTIREGDGQIGRDLHPDSLFLRWLGQGKSTAPRYQSNGGKWLRIPERIVLEGAFQLAQVKIKGLIDEKLQRPVWVREAILARVDALRLTDEIVAGDGVVTEKSATAAGPKPKVWKERNHIELTGDEEIVTEVLKFLKE